MAEGEGFEPSIRFPVYTLSRRAPSTTRPPLQIFRFYSCVSDCVRRSSIWWLRLAERGMDSVALERALTPSGRRTRGVQIRFANLSNPR